MNSASLKETSIEELSDAQISALKAGAVYYGYDTVEHGDYIIGVEKMADVRFSMLHLFNKQRAEVEPFLEADALFDFQSVERLENEHKFIIFTVRHKGELVGDALFLLHGDYSCMMAEYASDHGFYLLPEHRKGRLAKVLLQYAEDALRNLGVERIFMGDKSPVGAPDLEPFFKRAGYELMSRTFMKRL